MLKRYQVIDLEYWEPSGRTVMLDLDDDLACGRTVMESDLGPGVGPQTMINRGRDIMAQQRANVDAGIFRGGEHPDKTVR